jgi:hypothetical protein
MLAHMRFRRNDGLKAAPVSFHPMGEGMTIASTPSRQTFWRQASFNPPDLD